MENIKIYAFADEASTMIDEQIVAMNKNGLNGLEMRSVDDLNVSDISEEKAKEVKKKLDANGLITWSMGSPIGKIDIEKDDFLAHLEKLKHTIEIAHILEAKNIRLFSFFMPEGSNYADYKEEVIERLGKFVEVGKGSGINLCHENEKGIYGDMADRCLEILKAVPELKGVFDPANFVQCGQDTIDAWNKLAPYIHYMHIKDSLTNGCVVPAGEGEGNVEYVVGEFLKQGGRDFTIEPHLATFNGLSELEQEGNASIVGAKYSFSNNEEAFDVACDAFKNVLKKCGK